MSPRAHLVTIAFVAVVTACGGATVANDDLEVNDVGATNAGLAGGPAAGTTPGTESPGTESPESEDDTTGDDGHDGRDVGDHDCDDHDNGGHGRHHRHKFSVLDRMDGVKDKKITIANLPAGLPDRLLEKLAKLDADHDGIVTRDEVKAFRKHRKHHRHDNDQDSDRD